jgi:molybdenum cofactor cytidylyltransferase
VTGRHHDAVLEALARDRVMPSPRIVRNPDPSRGQLSSLLAGMDAVLTARTEALMMTLVDVPLVRVSTVIAVIDEWRRSRAPIVRPAIGDRHGHPVIFDRAVFDEIRRAGLDVGAKSVVRAHEHEIVNVPVDDEGCVRDVDTPADYDEMKSV